MVWECLITSKAKVEHSMVAERFKAKEDQDKKLLPNESLNYMGWMRDTHIDILELGRTFWIVFTPKLADR